FSAGSDYSVTVVVKAESIIQDDTRLRYIQHADGSISPYIVAVVNGMPARVEPYKGDSVAQMVQVTFDFPACNDTSLTVDDVVFTDIRTPVIGETIDTVATVEYHYSENVPATRKTIDLTWLRIGDEGTELTATDVFEEGYEYAWVVALHTDAMSDFKVTDKRYSGNVSVRGALQTVTERCNDVPAEKGLIVGATYVPLTSLPAPIGRIEILGAIAPTAGEYPYYGGALAENQMPFAEITNVTWYENGNVMNASSAFKKGNDYRVTYTIETIGAHTFAQTAVIRASVNGSEQFYNGYEGSTGITVITSEQTATVSWRYGELGDASYTGVTDYVELSGLMLPAPGQIPDFGVDVDSAYTQFGGVTWYELDDNGYRMKALTPNDRFKKDTDYRAEICVLASAGRNLNIDSRGAYLNNTEALSYYLSDVAAIVYAQYNTADCISELDIINVQYPIGNKTPDTLAIPSIPGRAEGDLATLVAYDNGSDIDWHYETNPGTAVAGFSRLDGRFKTDRRHRAYVQVQTVDGAWFATDQDGNLVVNASIDGIPVDLSYTTDTYLSDGAVNKIEMARTYELAKNTDGVFVDGMLLTDGLYLDSNHWGIRTEDNVDKDAGYAYYENGVLTLCDFTWTTQSDYDAVASYKPLTVCARGKNLLSTDAIGINTSAAVTLTGDGSLELSASTYGVFTTGTLTLDSGTWYISADTYD
ncbi:MAG: hypothetical protein IJC52_00455, partial [Clostridia bacterium]|nr:hypothetical protein [Clostridia bacterium]